MELIQISSLPQLVPSRVCLSCEVCCRFPEANSFLRPYFTAEEIGRAVAAGVEAAHFSDHNGCQVSLVPNQHGEGYHCPAFDPVTSHCRIYDVRPLDCQIYPFAVMWNADHSRVVLGWDSKCPFMRDHAETGNGPADIQAYADRIAALVERDDSIERFATNPPLIGRFQEDVVTLRPLPRLTARLNREASDVRREAPSLTPLTLADRPRLEGALASAEITGAMPLATYAFAPHMIWRALFSYWWAELAGHLCLFAEHEDGLFLSLPPLGPGPMSKPLARAFSLMRERNRGSSVSRVENVSEKLKPSFEALGYQVKPKDPDYLYRTHDLIRLAGDRYKSQRAACNRFVRERRSHLEPYQDTDRDACLVLFREWAVKKTTSGLDAVAQHMLADAESAHLEALTHHRALGLVGKVVRVGDMVRAYTFGYELSPSVFCVLLEVTDHRIPGLGPFVFREFCREAETRGYQFVNTMDDSGLPSLARSKQAYHPCRLVSNYVATES
ncbi:MAG TPA: phosphatidylglycerol lysyltransferase domain-containing protein [Nitrospiraceae bacterium]|nr:phosphatidylglycerol lysyltransferase domain-containing protein [Nitrospiraceae bacterium]